ncbi:MAG TPA: cation:dicarboxylase symporter family transporter, partial [Candidatus Hydrogenedentes bacterium]|nr:cation:dicarboxylase symporter family transporter [Candidatus Hydrogenedentota bacterium]
MKRFYPPLLGILAVSLLLGAASVWPEEGLPSTADLFAHAAVIAVSLVVFFLVLPRFLSQPLQILVAMLIGIVVGWGLAAAGMVALVSDYLGIFGALFILLLKMVIIPLVFVSIVCGV